MAREITLQLRLSAAKGGASVSLIQNLVKDMVGTGMYQLTQLVDNTAPEALLTGETDAPPAYYAIVNLDTVNSITVGGDASLLEWSMIIPPESLILLTQTTTGGGFYAQASTAPVRIQVVAIDY